MRRSLLAGSALSILISTTALAQQGAPPADAPAAPIPGYYPNPNASAPPPGYAPQPGYTPQTYMAPPPPAGRQGFMPMVYLGVNSFQGTSGNDTGPGLRLGTILGGMITPEISLNGELTLDFINPSNVQSGTDVTAIGVDLAFSPLYHAPLGSAELVIGPKLGFQATTVSTTFGGQDAGSVTGSGYVFGFNAGLFGKVSPTTWLGGLLSFEGRKYTKFCITAPGSAEACSDSNVPDSDKVLGISAAAMF